MKIFADGADVGTMKRLADKVDGFTTNPSLMKKAGISDYRSFAESAIREAQGKPISFEVLADDHDGMIRQATTISMWGPNVYVKIPIVNAKGESNSRTIDYLAALGAKVNVTAVMTRVQAREAVEAIGNGVGIVSVFAGRIADAGRDPTRTMRAARSRIANRRRVQLLWASVREVYNVVQARQCGCDIITMTPEMISKLPGLGRDLNVYAVETVRQFQQDAEGITL